LRKLCLLGCAALLSACTQSPPEPDDTPPPSPYLRDSGTDYALEFDGTDDYASSGNAGFPFPLDPHGLSLWVAYRDRPDARQSFLALRRDREAGVEFGVENGVLTAWRYYDGSAYAAATSPMSADAWHHVAYVFDGMQHVVYLDGARVAQGDLMANHRTPTTTWLGTTDGSSDLFAGKLDEVRVWDLARTDAQIAAEAAGTVEPNPSGLLLHLTFDESGGSRAFDRSGMDNHATLGDGISGRMPVRVVSDSPHHR